MHAGGIGAVLAAHRNERAADVGIAARFDGQDLAPLHRGRGGIGVPARGRAGLAPAAPFEVGNHHPAGHGVLPSLRTRTLTRSALDPVASVSSSSIGMSAFMLGACRSLANGGAQWSNWPIMSKVSGRMPSHSIIRPCV